MLDEIGEMSPSIQAKFLRVLEGHPFERVGGSEPIKVDVRVIAATNRDLEKDVAEGTFRRDLYFRLHVLEIVVPAAAQAARGHSRAGRVFPRPLHRRDRPQDSTASRPRRWKMMLQYRWPGNVRELKNVIERAVVLARGEFIDHDDLILSTLATAGDIGRSSPRRKSHVRAAVARRHRAAAHPRHAQRHRLEQEPHRHHPGHRALDARPQNPPLRPQAAQHPRRRVAGGVRFWGGTSGTPAGNRSRQHGPCQLVWQDRKFGELNGVAKWLRGPCRLDRQDRKCCGWACRAGQTDPPAGRAGRGRVALAL